MVTVGFRLSMAAGWGITKISQNIEFTYKWAIENFDLAMVVGEGKLESGRFCIPGVPGKFHVAVEKKLDHTYDQMVKRVKLGDQEFQAKFYFSVSMKSTVVGTKAAGKLEVIKEGAKTLSGKFGDSAKSKFVLCWGFEPNCALRYFDDNFRNFYKANGFFTTGSTSLLNLVVTLTIPGKLITLGETSAAEDELIKQNRLMDFKHLLSDPKHSDIVLKCGDTRFLCHKVILASR